MSSEETNNDEVVAKYKKLLSLARSSLESNQSTIAAKDKQIAQLLSALEEERSKFKKSVGASKEDDLSLMPRNLLRRVDMSENCIWILIEYEGIDDSWKLFTSEQELDEYIQRVPGVPLVKPHRCLTPSESKQIEEESKKRVDKIVEEFRRYKVRSEISRKQSTSSKLTASNSPINSTNALSDLDISSTEDIHKLKQQYLEQETKWKTAFEKVVRENEQLRTRSSDIQLALQLRERYETCLKEKNELEEKIKVYDKLFRDSSNSIGTGSKSFEQAYVELRDEYKEFRRRVQAMETQRQIDEELKSSNHQNNTNGYDSTKITETNDRNSPYSDSSVVSTIWQGNPKGLVESKIQYIRQMVFQYLSCKEHEVKLHIESALIAIFRFNDLEKAAIEQRAKDETQDTLTSITNFLGGFTT